MSRKQNGVEPAAPSIEELIARLRTAPDDQEAWRLLSEQVRPRLAAWIRRRISKRFRGVLSGSDLAQKVMLKLRTKTPKLLERVHDARSLWALLLRLAFCEKVDAHRREVCRSPKGQPMDVGELEDCRANRSDTIDAIELVERSLARLRSKYREVVELATFTPLTQAEIARFLDVPVSRVEDRLGAARKELQKLLEPFFPDFFEHTRTHSDEP